MLIAILTKITPFDHDIRNKKHSCKKQTQQTRKSKTLHRNRIQSPINNRLWRRRKKLFSRGYLCGLAAPMRHTFWLYQCSIAASGSKSGWVLELRNTSGKLQPESQVLVHRFLFVYPSWLVSKKKTKKTIMSLFYVNFVSFLEKGGKALLLGSVFPVRCQTSF